MDGDYRRVGPPSVASALDGESLSIWQILSGRFAYKLPARSEYRIAEALERPGGLAKVCMHTRGSGKHPPGRTPGRSQQIVLIQFSFTPPPAQSGGARALLARFPSSNALHSECIRLLPGGSARAATSGEPVARTVACYTSGTPHPLPFCSPSD